MDDVNTNQDTLNRVCLGLLRRCSEHVFLLSISLNESGNEERGKLLIAIQSVLRNLPAAEMVLGRGVAVTCFDEHNPKEAVVIAVYS